MTDAGATALSDALQTDPTRKLKTLDAMQGCIDMHAALMHTASQTKTTLKTLDASSNVEMTDAGKEALRKAAGGGAGVEFDV